MKYHQRLRDIREDFDKKQIEIAMILDVTQQQYQLYESGKRELPMHLFMKLARFYNVSLDYLAGMIDEPKKIYDQNQKDFDKQLVKKYKEKKEYQKAINKLLDIKPVQIIKKNSDNININTNGNGNTINIKK